ncbi:MAG TPA: ABC transporter permease subunit, partial [Propionibacteriaceae bacterium]|nr:ABC transporter permease subunit [Propionibacteriaceae bacterium]
MTGYRAFLVKELREVAATWRLYVLPVTLLVCALASPLLAKATPYLVSTVANLPITLPDPTVADAYAQWTKNLGQVALLVVIVSFSGAVNGERSSGTAAMALSKGLTPAAFVAAKVSAAVALVVLPTALATVVMAVTTQVVFGEVSWARLLAATGAWVVLALWSVAAVFLLSSALDSASATAGLGIAAWVALSIVS